MSTKDRILTSIQPILNAHRSVHLNESRVEEVAKMLLHESVPSWNNELQLHTTPEETVQYYFFLDSLNFCFWPEKGRHKWSYKSQTGYYGFSSAIKDAFMRDNRLLDASYLAEISEQDFLAIFPDSETLQLMPERFAIIREDFSMLRDHFDGSVLSLLEESRNDVDRLTDVLLKNFPSFRDTVEVDGSTAYFLKRAQIFPSDVQLANIDHPATRFHNIDHLTIFPDYKLPQILEALSVIEYAPELDETIRREVLIPTGSERELEIRAFTIAACESLRDALERFGRTLTSQELDWVLWEKARTIAFEKPHHRTLTTNY